MFLQGVGIVYYYDMSDFLVMKTINQLAVLRAKKVNITCLLYRIYLCHDIFNDIK